MSRRISFKGKIADGTQERISLGTIRGETGYKIIKFNMMSSTPGVGNVESVGKIWTVEQTTIDSNVDLSKNTLIAVCYLTSPSTPSYPNSERLIFDLITFNQDIYITVNDLAGSTAVNYYIELEQFDLALDEQTVATLKDIRNTGSQ